MTKTVEAIYENGLLRPLEPLPDIAEGTQVSVSVTVPPEPYAWRRCIGILPKADAEEMLKIINQAFGNVNPEDWK